MDTRIAVSTWNTWGVPYASHLIFHRACKWRQFHDRELQKLLRDTTGGGGASEKDLLICCFQEVWSFHKGPLMDYTASLDPNRVTPFWEKMVLSLGILCRFFSCCRIWDAPAKLFRGSELEPRIDYAAVVGDRGMSLACDVLADSGLCILSTREPAEKGFKAYRSRPSGFHEERLANKGVLWAFWDDEGVLVLNTHLTTRRNVKQRQLDELKEVLVTLRQKFLQTSELSIYLCGDFNLDPSCPGEEFFANWYRDLGFKLLTTGMPSALGPRALDHIFLWRSDGMQPKTWSSEPIKPWDIEGFCGVKISDHCWQGVVISSGEKRANAFLQSFFPCFLVSSSRTNA